MQPNEAHASTITLHIPPPKPSEIDRISTIQSTDVSKALSRSAGFKIEKTANYCMHRDLAEPRGGCEAIWVTTQPLLCSDGLTMMPAGHWMVVSGGEDVPSDHMVLAARIDTEGHLLAPREENWGDCSVYKVEFAMSGPVLLPGSGLRLQVQCIREVSRVPALVL